MKRNLQVLGVMVLGSMLLAGAGFTAEKYPSRPITFVVPLGPGGMTDVTGRLLAEKFKAELGQPVLVVNKPGANGAIGLKYAQSQKADGYTVIVSILTDNFVSPYFQGVDPFHLKDFSFVASYMPQERVLFTTPDKPYKSFRELLDYAKKNPGQVSVGSGAVQWALEVVKSVAVKDGLKMKYVMFKSGGEASTAILGKHVDACETGTGTPAFQAAREGKLSLLVNLGSETVPFFPNTKNLKQLGYPFYTVVEYGLAVRSGTPEEIRKKLEDTLLKVMQDSEVKEKMVQMGLTPRFLAGKSFEKLVTDAVKSVPELIQYNKALPEG
ncbi:MAG: tripartite tricarboxylate transporter substrate binding protein [Deltaproteobacteria bacterium]|nr:MAG: tripartite tricarboxylate transporter substrate binding protein [Deltaproteobacteria bacterium]